MKKFGDVVEFVTAINERDQKQQVEASSARHITCKGLLKSIIYSGSREISGIPVPFSFASRTPLNYPPRDDSRQMFGAQNGGRREKIILNEATLKRTRRGMH